VEYIVVKEGLGAIEMTKELDEDREIKIKVSDGVGWLNKEEAMKIIRHLEAAFDVAGGVKGSRCIRRI